MATGNDNTATSSEAVDADSTHLKASPPEEAGQPGKWGVSPGSWLPFSSEGEVSRVECFWQHPLLQQLRFSELVVEVYEVIGDATARSDGTLQMQSPAGKSNGRVATIIKNRTKTTK